MFDFIKQNLQKIYNSITTNLLSIFTTQTISPEIISEIERILISADTGITTTKKIIACIEKQYKEGKILNGLQLQKALEAELLSILESKKTTGQSESEIFLLVGINGSGKTTFAGKLAYTFSNKGKRCILAAGDTFRAAAPEQLKSWAQLSNAELFAGKSNQDPATIAYGACQLFKETQADTLIIDTAGRLQTKENLMKELTKIKKIIEKQLPDKKIHTLLTVDAMLGQNSFHQAQIFNEAIKIDGIVLTKIDGTGKGGIIFSITEQLNIPVEYICFGEKIDTLKLFDAQEYVSNLLGSFTKGNNESND